MNFQILKETFRIKWLDREFMVVTLDNLNTFRVVVTTVMFFKCNASYVRRYFEKSINFLSLYV